MGLERAEWRIIVGVAFAAGVLAAATVWWNTPDLRVDIDEKPAVAHMELLGEYPSDIRSVEITPADEATPVWRIVADGEFFQIHSIPLRVGENPGKVHLYWGTSRQLIPAPATTFHLDVGAPYRITICPAATLGLCSSARFALPR